MPELLLPIRTMVPFLGPPWLTRERFLIGDVEIESDNRVLYTTGTFFDTQVDRVVRGVIARYPGGGAPEDALPYIGRDDGIIRGPEEVRESYEARLVRSIDDWRTAGIAWSMLEQLRAYCTPHAVRVRIVNEHGNYYQIDRDGSRSRSKGLAWNWDDHPERWARFWVHLYMTDESPSKPWAPLAGLGDANLWGGEVGDPAITMSSTARTSDVAAVRSIVRSWKPAGSRCVKVCIIFVDDAAAFELDAIAPPAPDGTWGWPSANVGGVQVATRSTDAIYWHVPEGP